MNLSFSQKILLHSSSLFLSTIILIVTELSKLALVSALCLVVYNLKNIISSIINRDEQEKKTRIAESPVKRLERNAHGRFDVSEFEDRVRSAFLKNANKKCGYFEQENKYWHNNYFGKSDNIEELKDVKLTDLRRDRIMKSQQNIGLKLQFSTAKKIRTFLETRQSEDKGTIRKIKQWAEMNFKNIGEPFSKIQLSDRQIELSLSLLQQYITSKISDDYEDILDDFNSVDKVLQKCFSLSLSLQQGTNSMSISFADLKSMMELIDRKDMLLHGYTTNLSPHQIKKELLQVRNRFERLPDFSQPPNLLRLSLFMKHLRKQFQDLNISFSGFNQKQRLKDDGSNHIFKYQDNLRLYYSKVANIKSKISSTPVFLFLMSIWKQYHRSNKSIIREVKSILIM